MSQPDDSLIVIAEAGVNHNGSLETAHQLIDVARDCGADVVKFQLFEADRLATREVRQAEYQVANMGVDESQHTMLRRLELGRDAHKELAQHAAAEGLEFLSTPFDEDGLDFLIHEIGVRRIKISSADLTNVMLVGRAALSELPVLLSTGMASVSEIADAVDLFAYAATSGERPTRYDDYGGFSAEQPPHAAWRQRLTLMQCTSEYPTPEGHENVRAIVTMKRRWRVPVGFSDHTLSSTAAVCGVALGATVVEKHFTLDRSMSGPDHAASLAPAALAEYVRTLRHAQVALGSGIKEPTAVELETAKRVRKVIVAARDICEGDAFSTSNLTMKRAGRGMPSRAIWNLLGRRASKPYLADQAIDELFDGV